MPNPKKNLYGEPRTENNDINTNVIIDINDPGDPVPQEPMNGTEFVARMDGSRRLVEAEERKIHAQAVADAPQRYTEAQLFRAEGKLYVKSYRDTVKEFIDRYRADPPENLPAEDTPQYRDGYLGNLDTAIRKFEGALLALNDYISDKIPPESTASAWSRSEFQSYQEGRRLLNEGLDSLNRCFLFSESDNNPDFRRLYGQASNFVAFMENLERGSLTVPRHNVKTLNGKRVHFVDAHKKPNQPLAKVYNSKTKKLRITQNLGRSDSSYLDMKNMSLFTHDPCPEDINQNQLGNCYMLSMLSSICQQDPQRIKDAMADNGDGTVTVRFFNDSLEPVFVTVTKDVPGKDPDTGRYREIYSSGPLWVKMMEKAYAASGLATGNLSKAENPNGNYVGSYAEIANGYTMDFVRRMTGENIVADAQSPSLARNWFAPAIPKPNNRSEYSEAEKDFAKQIEDARKAGYIMYAGARFDEKRADIQSERIPGTDNFTGILSGHAYSLVGTETIAGKIYIQVRNPHGKTGRQLEQPGVSDRQILKNDVNGYNLVELKSFGKYFDTVEYATTNAAFSDRINSKEVKGYSDMYGSVMRVVNSTLQNTNGFFYNTKRNSDAFTRMAEAASLIDTIMASRYPNPNFLRREFDKLFQAAHDYKQHRDTQVRDPSKETGTRAVNRYQMCEIVLALEEKYKNNPDMIRVSLADVTGSLGVSDPNDSPAKRASADKYREMQRRRQEAAARQAAKQRRQNAPQGTPAPGQQPGQAPDRNNGNPQRGGNLIV